MHIQLGVLKPFSDSVCEMYMEYIFYMCAKKNLAAAWTVFDVRPQTKSINLELTLHWIY